MESADVGKEGNMRRLVPAMCGLALLFSILFPVRIDILFSDLFLPNGESVPTYRVVTSYGVFHCPAGGLLSSVAECFAESLSWPASVGAMASAIVATILVISSFHRGLAERMNLVLLLWCIVYIAVYALSDLSSILSLFLSTDHTRYYGRPPYVWACLLGLCGRLSVFAILLARPFTCYRPN